MLRVVLVSAALLSSWGCAAAIPDVTIHEDRSVQMAGHGVGLGPIVEKRRFKQGRPVQILLATIFVHEKTSIRKEQVAEGDDILIGSERWYVKKIVRGGAQTRGIVVLEKPR